MPDTPLDLAVRRTRTDLEARDDADLYPRVLRSLAAENEQGPWALRRDSIRWRVRLAAQAARTGPRRRW